MPVNIMVWKNKDVMPTRKLLAVLIVGFIFGFILGIIVLSPFKHKRRMLPESSATCVKSLDDSIKSSQSYESWLLRQGVNRKLLDVDEYLYGKNSRKALLEAEWLKRKVHITCVVFVEKEKNIIAAKHTWLKHCNDYAFFHSKKPHVLNENDFAHDLDVKKIEGKSSWDFICKSILELWRLKKNTIQWLLFVSDDMFVVPENLRLMVAHLDWKTPYYLGHAQSLWGQPYNVAIAGYVLSNGAMELLAANFSSPESCPSGGKYWKKEDYYLGKNLQKLCIMPSDTRDDSGKGRFHGYNLNQLLFSNKLALISSYWKNSIYPSTEGKSCCSELSVTFQGIEADKMYMYDYIINHLKVFTHGLYGNQPAPTPYPPEEVWQEFMKSRGYSSVQNVSSRQYVEAWKTKIKEDLIKAGFTKKKYRWRNMDFKTGDGHGEVIPLPFQLEAVQDAE